MINCSRTEKTRRTMTSRRQLETRKLFFSDTNCRQNDKPETRKSSEKKNVTNFLNVLSHFAVCETSSREPRWKTKSTQKNLFWLWECIESRRLKAHSAKRRWTSSRQPLPTESAISELEKVRWWETQEHFSVWRKKQLSFTRTNVIWSRNQTWIQFCHNSTRKMINKGLLTW